LKFIFYAREHAKSVASCPVLNGKAGRLIFK
jgi:hypothetical protein